MVVVNKMTHQEESLINYISKKVSQCYYKKLYVIHNFLDLTTKDDVEKNIEKDIVNSFNVYEI